jgi:hypothetical protein
MSRTPTDVTLALAILLAAIPAASLAAPPDAGRGQGWELKQKSDDPAHGYALYVRPRAGSEYDEYRLEVTVDGKVEHVIAALEHNMLDPDTYPKGMKRTLLRREDRMMVSYDYIEVPFLSDRDVVIQTEIGRDPKTGQPNIRWHAIQGEGPAPRDGVVRMPSSSGSWTLTPRARGTLAVYQSHVELGGSIPAAIVESRMPAEIVQQAVNLRRRVREITLARR